MGVICSYDLDARYDSRASFYGKALVENHSDGSTRLYSYGTLVAEIKPYDNRGFAPVMQNMVIVYGTYSQTTLRHIKEFLKQNGFKAISKAQIEKDYMEGEE